MPITLDDEQKVELSEILEKSDWLSDARSALQLAALVPNIRGQWAAGDSPKRMALSLVSVCDEFEAIEKLVAALERVAEGSVPAIRARAFLKDVTASANFSRV